MYQNPSQVSGWPYTSGARNGPPEGQLEEDRNEGEPKAARHIATRRLRWRTSGATAKTNKAIPGCGQQHEAMVAEREGEHDRGCDESAICAAGARPFETLPVDEQDEQQGGQDQVESVGVGVRADRPGDRSGREEDPAGQRDPGPSREPVGEDRGQARGDRQADRIEQVHPERRLAEWRQDDRAEPAEDHPGREPGRMRGPEQRADGLELGRVPERDPRTHGRDRHGQGDGGRPQRGEAEPQAGTGPRLVGHHPRRWPHVTPQATIAIDSAMRP